MDEDEFSNKYIELEILGEGGSAVVRRVQRKADNLFFASKSMRKYDNEKEANSRKEYEMMKTMDHNSIIKVEEFIVTENWTHLIMELAPGKELQKQQLNRAEMKGII